MRDEGAQLQAKEAEKKRLTLLAARTINVSSPSAAAAAADSVIQRCEQGVSDSNSSAANTTALMTPLSCGAMAANARAAHVNSREIEHAAMNEIMFTLDELSLASRNDGDSSDDNNDIAATTKAWLNADTGNGLRLDHSSSIGVQQQNSSNSGKRGHKSVCIVILGQISS
jgi:hypothetical protein